MTIRIIIAEDHAVLCAALRALLDAEPDLEVLGEATDAGSALCLSIRVRPDIILLDVGLPDLWGFESIHRLLCALPDTHVLLLTDYQDAELVRDALLAGASGCVTGKSADSTLAAALRLVAQGYLYIQPDLMQTLFADLRMQPALPAEAASDLTPSEADVLRMLAQGHTNRQVAEALGLSTRAVESQREKIMAKLGLRTRAQLVRYALARRLAATPNTPSQRHSRPQHP